MKTLDEVIKAYECCMNENTNTCLGCPYADETGEAACFNHDRADALNYLKAYRDDKNDLTALRAFWKEQHENHPLTWDKLKTMEGKPVWLEDQFQNNIKTWCIVERIVKDEDCEYVILDGLYFPKDYLGEKIDGWQAYRKERK